jgi:pimeloyl-ACP methyl ester carboxylesterase
MSERRPVILLPGIVRPAQITYADLIAALGSEVDARAKELEVYASEEPPAGYRLELELEGVLRLAAEAGFGTFHLVGYSAGAGLSLLLTERHPERLRSLALLEPAWMGWQEQSEAEARVWRRFEQLERLPPREMMAAFVAHQLAPGVEPPREPGPPPEWMAKRPAGIRAVGDAFRASDVDLDRLRRFDRPVYYALGELSNPDYYGQMARRLAGVFSDYTLETFAERHHFAPPHRFEPERVAASLLSLWRRADG